MTFDVYITQYWHKSNPNGGGYSDADAIAAGLTQEEFKAYQAFLGVAYHDVYIRTGELPSDPELIQRWHAEQSTPKLADLLDQIIALAQQAKGLGK